MTSERDTVSTDEKTTLNISLTVDEKRFLKVYAAKNGLTVSGIIQKYIEGLRKKSEAKD
ncbi:MAG: hypothetical protein PUJ57_01930 [Peptoniphilaceae bacterium]|nr:hypothetical protein [Peptoniphilaceae bacterium]